MEDLYERRDEVNSMHIFSDASPVTGTELQGMILQICLQTIILIRILPGVALHYGNAGVVHKAFALIWAIYLIVGPSETMLRWVFTSMTHRTQYMVVCLARPDGPSALERASDVSSKIPEFRVGRVPLPPVRSLLLKVLKIVVNFLIFRCYHMITCFRSYV